MTAQTILPANSVVDSDIVTNSYRSNIGDSPRLSKTFSSASNSNTTFTVSAWVKRSELGATQDLISAYRSSDGLQTDVIRFGSADDFEFYAHTTNSSGNADIQTNRLFRDVGAWYHIVVRVDTTQSTASNRVRIYVNGVQETSFSSANYMNQNGTIIWGLASGIEHTIGAVGTSNYFGGYVAEVVYLDSQSVAPTTFGEFDGDSGIWKPIDVTGLTYGNNSFYLDFENSAELGTDVSGNSHTFTENNIDATDQSTDTCVNNFATLNSLDTNGNHTFSEGNLKAVYSAAAGTFGVTKSTIGVSSGKWYWEVKYTYGNAGQFGVFDVNDLDTLNTTDIFSAAGNSTFEGLAWRIDTSNNIKEVGEGQSADSGLDFASGAILGIAFDADNGKFYGFKNGAEITGQDIGAGTSLLTAVTVSDFYLPFISNGDGGSGTKTGTSEMNFGSPPHSISSGNADADGHGNFEYAVPSGYFALCTKNLAEYG